MASKRARNSPCSQRFGSRRFINLLTVAAAIFTAGLCKYGKDISLVAPDGQQPLLKFPVKTPLVRLPQPSKSKPAPGPDRAAPETEDSRLPRLPSWQLGDEQIVDAFRAHEANEKHGVDIDKLATLHPFARDTRIAKFDAVNHAFYIENPDGKEVKCRKGVTSLLRWYSQPFDAAQAIEMMKKGQNWESRQDEFRKEDGTIMSDEEIKAFWSFKGKVSSSRGSLLHEEIERNLNGFASSGEHSPEFKHFLKFKEEELEKKNLQVWRTEAILFHCGLRACGITDLLCRDGDGRLVIMDWKRSAKVKLSNHWQRMKAPVAHLDDCNFNVYSLQLNMYRYILESEYGEEVSGMYLVQLHPDFPSYQMREVKRMDKEVDSIVSRLKVMGKASEPCEGPHAVFQADY